MDLKHTIFFLIIITSVGFINQAQAFTVCDLLHNPNITAQEIQQAVDNGSIQYSDLPGSFQVNIHAQGETISHPTKSVTDNSMPCDTKKQNVDLTGLLIMILAMLSPLFAIMISRFVIHRSRGLDRTEEDDQTYLSSVNSLDSRGAMPKGFGKVNQTIGKQYQNTKPYHPPHARLLLALRIIRVKKNV